MIKSFDEFLLEFSSPQKTTVIIDESKPFLTTRLMSFFERDNVKANYRIFGDKIEISVQSTEKYLKDILDKLSDWEKKLIHR